MSTSDIESTAQLPDQLSAQLETLQDRIDSLEAKLTAKDERIEQLEQAGERTEERTAALEERVAELEDESTRLESLGEAAIKKASANKVRVTELQSRELEKGAHLREETVDEHAVDVPDGRLERLTKEDGKTYYRLPEQADPLERGGDVSLAYGDLLPIQQLAKMDEEMLRSTANALPTRLAAKLWQGRTDDSIGDNPWERGCKDVDEYVKAVISNTGFADRKPGLARATQRS